MKNIIIISSSFRKDGNSETLAKAFAKGAASKGHQVRTITIRDLELKYCIGCLSCQKTKRCVLKDSMNSIYDEIQQADTIVFATPIYYYAISGQLKTFIDRLNPLFSRETKFKEVYLLSAAADPDESAIDGALKDVQGFVDCFDGVELKKSLIATNVTNAGEVEKTKFTNLAYIMGFNIDD